MKIFTILVLLVLPHTLAAQDFPLHETDLQKIADDLYGFPDQDMNYDDLFENLTQLLSQPVNLNKASSEDLRFLNILSETQITNIVHHRETFGDLLSVYELQAVPAIDAETFYRLMPFVKVVDPSSYVDRALWKRIREESTNYVVAGYGRLLEKKNGEREDVNPDHQFKGSADRLYMRLRSSRPGDFSFGITLEKDAGERVYWSAANRYYGMDYNAVHAQLLNKGRIKNIILGDYQCQYGQGIMFGGLFGMGKGGETITTIRRSTLGALPYTSAYEAGALRGMAVTAELTPRITLSGHYSSTRRDANVSDDADEGTISSFQTTGLHRNARELSTRQAIREMNTGAVLRYQHKALDAGIMYNVIEFDAPVLRRATLYNQFYFNGQQNQNAGVFVNYYYQNVSFFGEIAKSLRGGYAHIAGVLWSMTPRFDLSLLHRKYDRNFYTFYSNAFAEGSLTQNESGVYAGWKYKFNRKISASGYVDFFSFPWIKFRSYIPSYGHETLLRISYQPYRGTTFFIQAREEKKVRNVAGDKANLYTVSESLKRNYTISGDYPITRTLRMKTRIQMSTFSILRNTTKGLALLQDIQVDLGRLTLTGRYALFDTDDFDNRQYAYENDVWLSYSMPAYYGKGVRKYLLAAININRHVTLWLRYAHTRFTDRQSIGTGADEVKGNVRDEVKAQLRVKF